MEALAIRFSGKKTDRVGDLMMAKKAQYKVKMGSNATGIRTYRVTKRGRVRFRIRVKTLSQTERKLRFGLPYRLNPAGLEPWGLKVIKSRSG